MASAGKKCPYCKVKTRKVTYGLKRVKYVCPKCSRTWYG